MCVCVYPIMTHFSFLLTPECNTHCTNCETNGVGKCDLGKCKSGWKYRSSDHLCEGELIVQAFYVFEVEQLSSPIIL